MRRGRFLLLIAIAGVLAAVGISYLVQTSIHKRQAPPKPAPLPPNTNAAASGWSWTKTEGSRTAVEVRAEKLREIREPSRVELERVELRIYDAGGNSYDEVRCARARLDTASGVLHSGGEVEITMGLSAGAQPAGRLIFISATGVTFDSRTGKVSTEGRATFRFDQGEGRAVGAFYDPNTRELQMRSDAEVVWFGNSPGRAPMKVEAGALSYRERDSAILLSPWSRLTRGNTRLEGGEAFVFLEEGTIRRVDTRDAKGEAGQGERLVEYAAENLRMEFARNGAMERILGDRNARLASSSRGARTEVKTDRLELFFGVTGGDSRLEKAIAMGHSVVESSPLEGGGGRSQDARILRSEVVHLAMKPGGEEIQSVETHTPGSIEFLPNLKSGRKRRLEAERMWIDYGEQNRIRSFRAVSASTRTEIEGSPAPPILTWSNLLVAHFDAGGGFTGLEQSDHFRYEEGARRGTANRAVLDAAADRITLEGAARLWDPTGSTSANRIVLDQKSGDLMAEGKVASSRVPDRRSSASVLMSQNEAVHATASKMWTRENNRVLRYEGSAVLWQGGNRIEADRLEIDRLSRKLVASGRVKTRFVEERLPAAPAFTVIDAAEMAYEDGSRVAHYRGGVRLVRDNTEVTSKELRAHLLEAQSGSQLEKAIADGDVVILSSSAGRSRRAAAEHAEYYAAEQRVLLSGGQPTLVDSVRGMTSGRQLTWFANDDRLLVEGSEGSPSKSHIRRN